MSFKIVEGNIVTADVDAVVNAANTNLLPGGGVCGAIFDAAGYDDLHNACLDIGYCAVGSAVMTDGYRLPAKKIIHTVGPIYNDGESGEEEALRNAYRSSLNIAKENGLSSIAFPLVSSGIYAYPRKEAFRVACEELNAFADANPDMEVLLYLLNKSEFVPEDE